MDRAEYLRRNIELGRELIRCHEELLKEERIKLATNLEELRKICTHDDKSYYGAAALFCNKCNQLIQLEISIATNS